MTLIKSLLLGSAAGLVAVASAQAADLPTRKGPVAAEYVRVCSITVAGAPVVGFVLPGSDTCFKISGYITGQIEGGNLQNGHSVAFSTGASLGAGAGAGAVPATAAHVATRADGITQGTSGITGRDSIGWTTRFNLTLDAVSNTAYGPLVAHGEYQFNYGQGFDTTAAQGSDGGLNRAYVTWAGLTAGKIDSFFSFTGGGYGWANFFSPDRKGYNQPDVLAYTASFGGGFAATISLESTEPGSFGGVNDCQAAPGNAGNGFNGCNTFATSGSDQGFLTTASWNGTRVPDIVGALSVHQAWGSAQVSGVAHNVRAAGLDGSNLDTWGWAIDAGVQFNIPNFAGSQIGVTGAWSRNAAWYSGIPDGMWGEDGAVNGNGQAMAIGDAYDNGNGTWAVPTLWSVTGYSQFTVNPQVTLQFEGSYGQVRWTNTLAGTAAGSMLFNSNSFLVGGLIHYDPVKNLDIAFELLYQDTQSTRPTALVGPWDGTANGFAARLEITRSF